MLATIQQLKRARREAPIDERSTLTAYEIYQKVKESANPKQAYKSRSQATRRFHNTHLPKGAGRIEVDQYIIDRTNEWTHLRGAQVPKVWRAGTRSEGLQSITIRSTKVQGEAAE
jgi:hypothetical protein